MSAIALPDFMARTSLKKPLDQSRIPAPSQARAKATGSAFRVPQYRIRFVQPGAPRSVPATEQATARPAVRREAPLLTTAPASAAQTASRKLVKRSALRLTRKGRLLFRGIPALTLAVFILLGALTFLNPGEAKSSVAEIGPAVSTTLTVMHGDSLWDIAARVAPEQDNRDVINQIMQINDLTTAQVRAGQVLEVPVYTSK